MILSDEHKLVFIHIPKTGGSAITHELATRGVWNYKKLTRGVRPKWQTFYHRASRYSMHSGFQALLPKHREYTRFASIRSPFTWALSHFNRVQKRAGLETTREAFHEWLEMDEPTLVPNATYRYQSRWVDAKTRLVRFETLAADLKKLMASLGIKCDLGPPIPGQESISPRAPEFYSPWALERVVELWREDFDRFGYSEELT